MEDLARLRGDGRGGSERQWRSYPPSSGRARPLGPHSRPLAPAAHALSGFFAIVLVYLLVRYTAGGGRYHADAGSADAISAIDAAARGWAVPMAFLEYLKMLAFPHP